VKKRKAGEGKVERKRAREEKMMKKDVNVDCMQMRML